MLNGEPENSERSSDIISNDLAIRPCGSSGGEGRLTRSDHRIRPRDVSYLEWLDSVAGPTVKLAVRLLVKLHGWAGPLAHAWKFALEFGIYSEAKAKRRQN